MDTYDRQAAVAVMRTVIMEAMPQMYKSVATVLAEAQLEALYGYGFDLAIREK